jgi:hypothetical protein
MIARPPFDTPTLTAAPGLAVGVTVSAVELGVALVVVFEPFPGVCTEHIKLIFFSLRQSVTVVSSTDAILHVSINISLLNLAYVFVSRIIEARKRDGKYLLKLT